MRHPRTGAAALALVAALTACMPSDGTDGAWRTVSWTRVQPEGGADSLPLGVDVDYAAGQVSLRAAPAPLLYSAALTWDAAGASPPTYAFDSLSRTLTIELDRGSLQWRGPESSDAAALRLALSRARPLDLRLALSGTASDLDLSGLRIARAAVRSGMSDVELHVDEPNATAASELRLENRFGRLRARGLGNANAERVVASTNLGALELDFSGRWTRDVALELDADLSRVTLSVPEQVGVRIALDGSWGDPPPGWQRDGAGVTSPNWEDARYRLRVSGQASLARVGVR